MIKTLIAVALLLLCSVGAEAQVSLLPDVFPNFYNLNSLTPAALGFICTTGSGTNTLLATYQDAALQTQNQNPIRLDAIGRPVNGTTLVSVFMQPTTPYRISLYAAGTNNTCGSTPVGVLLRQVDGVSGNSLNVTWIPSTTPALDFQEAGALHAHGTHQPTGTDFKNMTVLDLSNPATNGKQALYINTKETSSSGPRNVTGLWIDSYTLADNGGDVSGLHIVDTGAGDAASLFHLASERPVGYALPCDTCGVGLEIGVDHGKLMLLNIDDNATDGRPFAGQGVAVNVFTTSTGIPVFNVVTKTPNTGVGQLAYRAGDDAGIDDRFLVSLDTGNVYSKGKITTDTNFIVGTFGKGIYFPNQPFANQPHIVHNGATGQLEFTGGTGSGSGGTISYNFLDNNGSSLLQILTAGGLAIPRTSNQILMGNTNTSLLNFPAPASSIQLTFPITTSFIQHVDAVDGRMYGNSLMSSGSDFSGTDAWMNLGAITVVESSANAAVLGLSLGGGRATLFSNKTNGGTARALFLQVAQTDVVKLENSGTDRTCIYINGALRVLTLSGSNVTDGGACP